MFHHLKIDSTDYEALAIGKREFDIRRDLDNFQIGDTINYLIRDSVGYSYVVTKPIYQVVYKIQNVPKDGLMLGYCILGLKKLSNTFYDEKIIRITEDKNCMKITVTYMGYKGNYDKKGSRLKEKVIISGKLIKETGKQIKVLCTDGVTYTIKKSVILSMTNEI